MKLLYRVTLLTLIVLAYFASTGGDGFNVYANHCSKTQTTSCSCPDGSNYVCTQTAVHHCELPNGACTDANVDLECDCANKTCNINQVTCTSTGGGDPGETPSESTSTLQGNISCANSGSSAPGVPVYIKDSLNNIVATGITDNSGSYSINVNVDNIGGTEYAVRANNLEGDPNYVALEPVASGSGCIGPHENCPESNLQNNTLTGFNFETSDPDICGGGESITQSAVVLGRIYKEDNSCENGHNYYGNNCGSNSCAAGPNYSITWNQGGNSGTVNNNSCTEGWKPRYTFENTTNPVGDADGEPASISVNVSGSDSNYKLTNWFQVVTNSAGERCSVNGEEIVSNGVLDPASSNPTINLDVYSFNDCRWNHIWFYSSEGEFTSNEVDLSGYLYNEDNACTDNKNYYGGNCGGGTCESGPSYQVTWDYGSESSTVSNNACNDTNGWYSPDGYPGFSFSSNPVLSGNSGTAEINVSVSSTEEKYKINQITRYVFNSNNQICHPTITYNLANPAFNITKNIPLHSEDDCQNNILVFKSNADTPSEETSISCGDPAFTVKDGSGNTIQDINSLPINTNLTLAPNASTEGSSELTYSNWQVISGTGTIEDYSNPLNITYSTPSDYNASSEVRYTVSNGTISKNCSESLGTLNINEVAGDVDISFGDHDGLTTVSTEQHPHYSVEVNTERTASIVYTADAATNYNYNLTLSCPSGVRCLFANGASSTSIDFSSITVVSGSKSGSIPFTINSSVSIPLSLSNKITALGTPPSIEGLETDNIEAFISAQTLHNITTNYIQLTGSDPAVQESTFTSNSEYCNLETVNNYPNQSISLNTNITEDGGTVYTEPYENIVTGQYSFAVNSGVPVENEVKCIKLSSDDSDVDAQITNANNLSFNLPVNSSDTELEMTVVVAPQLFNSWFQAYGGDIHAGSADGQGLFNSNMIENEKILDIYSNIEDGLLSVFDVIVPSINPPSSVPSDKYYIPYSSFKAEYFETLVSNLSQDLTPVSSFSDIDFSENTTPFYYVDRNLQIPSTSNEYIAENEFVPVIFVDGDVIIPENIQRMDAVIVSTEQIQVEGDNTNIQLVVNGALLGQKGVILNRNYNSFSVQLDPIEEIYFRPEIYFSDHSNVKNFSENNVYTISTD